MDIYLIRHADAEAMGERGDASRALTEKGRKQAEALGSFMLKQKLHLPRIVTSPYRRSVETASIIAGIIHAEVHMDERLACGMTPDKGSAVIHELGGDPLALVGHSPDLERFASHMIGSDRSGLEMKKGAVAAFEMSRPGFAGSLLRWLIVPKLLM